MKVTMLIVLLGMLMAAGPADDSAEAWLERIESRAAEVDTLRATLIYTSIQGLLGDEQKRIGTLIYDDADEAAPTRFAVRFDRIIIDDAMQKQDRTYIFDGVWLGERIEEHGRKVFIRRQLVADAPPADDKPEQDLLSLGEGPFILPLNLKKDQVLRKYEVTVMDAEDDDPANSVHLRLVPRPGLDVEQERIDLWFDRGTLLPVRARTLSNDETESIIVLREVEVNPQVEGETFDTTPPRGGGWDVEIKPLDTP